MRTVGTVVAVLAVGATSTLVPASLAAAASPATAPQQQPVDGVALGDTNVGAAAIAASATASGLTERPDMWTQNSRTFTDANGVNTTVVGLTALNYADANSAWQPIDDALVADTTTGYAWRNSADAYTVEFPTNLATGSIRVSSNGGWVAFHLTGATGSGVVSANTIIYANALPGVTITYAATPLGLKETLTLANALATSAFAAVVTSSDGLTTANQFDGSINFLNATNALIASLAKPWITDANQDMSGLDSALSTSLVPNDTNTWAYTLTASPTWLSALSRVWPVTIDPTVNTSTFGSTDCLMLSGHPTSGVCAQNPAGVGYHGDDSLIRRDVMYWVLSAIPSSATVETSDLELDEGLTAYSPVTLQMYRNNQSFSSVNATWNDADAHTANAWVGGGGGDLVGSPLVETGFGCAPPGCAGVVHFDLKGATQNWVSGTWASTGVVMREKVETHDGVVQFNDSHAPSGQPLLTVTWDRNPNTPVLTSPADGATGQPLSPQLSATITDPDGGGDLYATFFVRTHGSGTWNITGSSGVTVPTPDGSNSNGLSSGSTFSYTPGPLAANTAYDWAVQASDVNLSSAISGTRTFTTAPVPNTPGVSSARSCWPTNPVFTWTEARDQGDPTTIAGYNFMLDQTASESNVPSASQTAQTTATSQDYTGSSPYAEGTWYFHVRAQNSAGVWGNPNNPGYGVTIDRTAPTAPSNLTSNEPTTTPTSTTTFSTNWTAGTDSGCGVSGYYYAFDNSATRSNSTPIASDQQTTGTSAQVTNLADGTWYFHVRTADVAGNLSGYTTYGPVVIHATLLSIVKALTPSATGLFGRGQYLHYTVTVKNVSTTPTTLTAVTDTVTAGQLLSGSDVTLSLNGQNAWHCLRTDANHATAQCVISTNGTTLSTPASYSTTLNGGDYLTFTYTTLATGVENACTTTQNTVSAVDSAGTASIPPVPATICDTGLGIEPWWSYRTFAVSPQSTAQVNVANGNLVVQATDSTPMNARGRLGYVIRRTYNSQDTTALTLPGSLGAGWQLNVGATDDLAGAGVTPTALSVPTADSVAAPLGVTLVDRDGTRHVFTYRSASISITSPVDVASLTAGSPIHQLLALNPLLRPTSLGGSAFSHVCVDATYQAPPGVHLALWRYVGTNGTNGSTCSAALTDTNARILGFATMRPDRLRSEFDATGRLLDLIDGSGVDLRYAYGTTGELRSISEPRSCTGTLGGSTCRAILLTYSSDTTSPCPIPSGTSSSECITDPAGRRTIYAFDNGTPKHLVEVDNPDDNPSGTRDRVQYSYQSASTNCGGSAGQLCTVIDPRIKPGNIAITTTFAYTSQSLGLARVTGVTDRRGVTTTFAYTGAPATATTADVDGERASYLSIDSSGRVGEIDLGATTGNPLSVTRYTWDSASNSCTFVAGTVQGSHTAWARQDNNLCQITRAKISAASDETTSYTYTPEGMLLTSRQIMSSGPDLHRTFAYATQYVRNGSASITATDSVSGNGDVAIGSRSTAIGDGGAAAGDPNVVYALTDLVAGLTPRGNVSGATVANFRTDYGVADNPSAEPDVNPNGGTCAALNSGSVCSVAAPDVGTTKSTTNYGYDDFGQKLTASVPKAATETAPNGQVGRYTYTYYPAGSTDSASHSLDTEGWLEAVTDPASRFAFFAYDAAGNVVRSWDRNATAGQSVTSMSAAVAAGSPPAHYRQTLHAATIGAMPWRYVLSSADALGNTTGYQVDVDGDVTQITSPRTFATTQTFDEAGNLLSRTTPAEAGHPAAFTYDAFGNLASATSPNGGVTAYRYDALNRRITTYADRGDASAGTVNPGGGCFVTDTGGNALPEYGVNEVVCATRMSYDEFGNVVSSIDGANHTTAYTYDTANRRVDTLTPRTDAVSYTTRTLYDADSNPIDTCPPRQFIDGGPGTCSDSSPGVYSTHRTYSEADRVLTSTAYRARPTTVHGTPANAPATSTNVTTYTYDVDGNRTSVTDPNGHTTSDVYDFLDRKTIESTTRATEIYERTIYGYDANGNLLSTTAPGLAPVTTGGTNLSVSGSQYGQSTPYQLPANATSYHSITLSNGAWITMPANSQPAAITINVAGTVTICNTCGITLDGDGWAGGQPAASSLTTGGFTVGGAGTGSGGGGGGTSDATAGGGGGGAGYASAGVDGSTGGLLGGAGGTGGPAYGDPSIGGETAMQAGSGGGAGGTIGVSTLGGAGGAGGGFLHLTANQIILDGSIDARGANGADGQTIQGTFGAGGGGGGSGGAVWLTAPQITTDSVGRVDVSGGAAGAGTPGGTNGAGGGGSNGRIRLDTDDLSTGIVTISGSTQRTMLGRITAYSYDADNRSVDTVTGASSTSVNSDGPTSSDGGSNVRTRVGYDADGNVVAHYDPRAFATSVSSPDRRYESVAAYDANDRLTDAYQPYSDASSASDPNGAPSQCPDATTLGIADYQGLSGVRVCRLHYGYDHDGNRTLTQLPTYDSSDTTRVYTAAYTRDDLLASTSNPNPSVTSNAAALRAEAYTYDGVGRRLTAQELPDSSGPTTTTTYTAEGLVATVTPPTGGASHLTTYGYDPNGAQISVTMAQDASTNRTSYTDYNSDGSVYASVDPAGNTTSYTYDAGGNRVSVFSPSASAGDTTNPNQLPTTYTFFDDNLLATTSTPTVTSGNTRRLTTYGYDLAGDKTSVDVDYTNASGTVTTDGNPQRFVYYPDGLLQSSTGRSNESQTFQYDASGHPTTSTDSANGNTVTTAATYYLNSAVRTVNESGAAIPTSSTTYSYDAAGAPDMRQDQIGATTTSTSFTYTDNEQMASVAGGVTGTTITMGYDAQGRPTTTNYRSGVTLTRTWSADNTLASQSLVTNGGSSNWAYGYDGLSRVTAADNTSGTTSTDCTAATLPDGLQCFTYDAAGRLHTFADSQASRTASYDADGNRQSYGDAAHPTAAPLVTAGYNPDDSIHDQKIGSGADNLYLYAKPFGGVTSDGCGTYAYDGFDRLASVTGTGSAGCTSTVSYTYDALDRQVQRNESGTGAVRPGVTSLAYDGLTSMLTSESLPSSSGLTRYTLDSAGAPLAVVNSSSGTTQYLADDGQGDVTSAVTSSSGNLACGFRYDPWGTTLTAGLGVTPACASSNTPTDLQYRSGPKDVSTGTYQLGSRTYDPTKAGFLNPDGYRTAPSAADLSVGTDPLTRDTYNYVNGDPINLIDPTGHRPCLDDVVGHAVCYGTTATIGPEVASINRVETLQAIKTLIAAVKNQIKHQELGNYTRCALEVGRSFSLAQRIELNQFGLGDDPCAIGNSLGAQMWAQLTADHFSIGDIPLIGSAIKDAQSCFTSGSVGGCVNTALNVAMLIPGVDVVDAGARAAVAEGEHVLAKEALDETGQVLATAAEDSVDASTTVGRRGSPMNVSAGTNADATIDGWGYSGHALDAMQAEGFTPTVVENALENGEVNIGASGRIGFYDPANRIEVVMESDGTIVTVTSARTPMNIR